MTVAATPPQLIRLRSLIDGTVNHFDYQWDAHDGAEPGSRARADLDLEGTITTEGDWWHRPVLDLQSAASVSILAASHHLAALSRAINAQPLPLAWAPQTLARACAEQSSRAWWVLEIDISAEQRVGRFANEALYTWYEGQRGGHMLNSGAEYQPLIDKTLSWATARGIETGPSRNGRWVGEQRLSAKKLLETMLPGVGGDMYSNLSPIAHGTLAGMLSAVTHPGEHGRAAVQSTFRDALISATCALDVFLPACSRLIDYLGWDRAAWRSWEDHTRQSVSELWATADAGDQP